MKRWAMLLALLAITGCRQHDSEEEIETTNPVPVVLATVTRGPIHAVVHATGMVTPAAGAELSVTAPDAARVTELPFAPGDRVRRGALLARFDVPAVAADVESRRGEVERAQARLRTAHEATTRLEGLLERGVAARKEVEEARREVAEAEADLRGATGALAAAESLAGRTVVKAPFDGVIAERLHNPGDVVGAADLVLRLIDPSRLQVEAAVGIAEVGRLSLGQAVTVRGPEAVSPATGSLVGLPGSADPATGTAKVRVALEGAISLPINTAVEVEISTAEHAGATLIPAAAVVEEAGGAYAYVVDAEHLAHRRPIEIGIRSRDQVEVRSGVAPGEQVIVEGHNALPDGAAVEPGREAAEP